MASNEKERPIVFALLSDNMLILPALFFQWISCFQLLIADPAQTLLFFT